jgi:hypothetical protein
MKPETKNCQNCKKDFTVEVEDFNFYEKIKMPAPTFCPECRNQRRMSWRNERSLHKINCKAPGHMEKIISMYKDAENYNIVDNDYWWSDKWDSLSYGREYDFSKTFFAQFDELLKSVPLSNLSTINSVNSEYTNFVDENKNCYLIFGSGWNENVRYGNKLLSCKDSQDLFMCEKCELSYECIDCAESYHLYWSFKSKNCTDSYFLYNCKNCTNCFGCANLVSQSYCIWNRQYTREEYSKQLENFKINQYSNFQSLRDKFIKEIYLPAIHRYANIVLSVNCTGDNITESRNCRNCFEAFKNVENAKYEYGALDVKESYDGNGIFDNELSYELVDCNRDANNFFGITTYDSNDVRYMFNCHNAEHCFGCVGIRKKSFCILNKQYSKEEYESLLPRIIKQMDEMPYTDKKGRAYAYGEFFPIEISPFAYNETLAYEYFPLEESEVLKSCYKWLGQEERNYDIEIKAQDLPDDIRVIDESIVGKVIACEHNGKCNEQCTEAFKITPEEFKFYKRMNISLPRLCPNCRHFQRLKTRNPLKLWRRSCMCDKTHTHHTGKCEVEFETSYSPDRPEIVYCEKCYQAEVY